MATQHEMPRLTVCRVQYQMLVRGRSPSDMSRETGWDRSTLSNIKHGERHRADTAWWYRSKLTARQRRQIPHRERKRIESDIRSPKPVKRVASSRAVSRLRIRGHLKVLESQGFRLTSLGNVTKRIGGVRTTVHAGKYGGFRVTVRSHQFRVRRATYRGPAEFVGSVAETLLERLDAEMLLRRAPSRAHQLKERLRSILRPQPPRPTMTPVELSWCTEPKTGFGIDPCKRAAV